MATLLVAETRAGARPPCGPRLVVDGDGVHVQAGQLGVDEHDRMPREMAPRRWTRPSALEATMRASTCFRSSVSHRHALALDAVVRVGEDDAEALGPEHALHAAHELAPPRVGDVGDDQAHREGLLAAHARSHAVHDVAELLGAAPDPGGGLPELAPSTPRRTRDTVAVETFAARATSAIVGFPTRSWHLREPATIDDFRKRLMHATTVLCSGQASALVNPPATTAGPAGDVHRPGPRGGSRVRDQAGIAGLRVRAVDQREGARWLQDR